jgi:DNA polymerase-3 subunit delta
MPAQHATAFLAKPPAKVGPVVVLAGDEAHLRQAAMTALGKIVLGEASDSSMGLIPFEGKQADLKAVRGELQTVSMFGSARLVVVYDADDFVTEHRAGLEAYAAKPAGRSVLVLAVKNWRSNTKLAKKVTEIGLELDCSELQGAGLTMWLVDQAQEAYGKQLTRDAAALMQELAGTSLTLLDQELAKLSAFVGDGKKIGPEEVRQLVGGWRAETTWTMINSMRDGQPAAALECLQKLLTAGEAPQKILGGINFVFRKIAAATEKSRSMPLRTALQNAGVFPRDADAVERYLRRVGRPRAERIVSQLVSIDRGLKGASRVPERAQLETLVLWLAGTVPV